IPRNILAGKPGERNDHIQVVEDETVIQINESEEGLNILDFPRFWPVNNSLDILGQHSQAIQR
ncbi:hypothetical protein CY34DRAFT_92417, partial [Suillus luteus UH-Slu-Lm8-n1]